MALGIRIIAAFLKSQFLFKLYVLVLQPPLVVYDLNICDEVGADWRGLGAVLGLESAFKKNIETDHSECREKARKVLQKRKQKKRKWSNSGNCYPAILTSRLVNNAY